MTTATEKKATRAHLIKAAKAGKLFVKCKYSLTDDYAFDNATGFGKSDNFVQVYFVPEHNSPLSDEIDAMYAAGKVHADVEPKMEELQRERQSHSNYHNEQSRGKAKMSAFHFSTKSGHCWGTTRKGTFSVHSNLSYEYEIR